MDAGAKLYNSGVDIKLISVITNGTLSLISKEVDSLRELEGKDLYLNESDKVSQKIIKNILKKKNIKVNYIYADRKKNKKIGQL